MGTPQEAQEVNKIDSELDSINGSLSEIGDLTNALTDKLARILLQPAPLPEAAKDTAIGEEDTPLQSRVVDIGRLAHSKVVALKALLDQIQW